jgi:hypothetical protein
MLRYVEPLSETRTKPGERCVLAHLGWAGEKSDFFSILLGIDVEVRDEWVVSGRRSRTMACVATTTSR